MGKAAREILALFVTGEIFMALTVPRGHLRLYTMNCGGGRWAEVWLRR